MAFVELSNVGKSFGQVEVLHDLTASINEGEFVAILGESGCGKSTLLRLIAGLEDISSGEISIGGTVVNGLSPRDRNIAMVFQSYALYPHMTVEQNIRFPLQLSNIDEVEQKIQLDRAAKMLNLGALLKRKPRDLSGGQRQRVAMGRAIVRNPKVFLFDEPLSNLDAKLRVQMRTDIRLLQRELGITAIYVTHDQIEAMTMADRVILMNEGKIEQFGPPLDLYDRPASEFVANFVGSPAMNLLHGVIENRDGPTFVGDEFQVLLESKGTYRDTRTLGIRPEDVKIVGGSEPHDVAGTITNIECTGDRTFLELSTKNSKISVTSGIRSSLSIGEEIHVSIPPEKCHFFNENRKRIDAGSFL